MNPANSAFWQISIRWRVLGWLAPLLLAAAPARAATEPPWTNCDTYAALYVSLDGSAPYAVSLNSIVPDRAIPACTEALTRYPESNRLMFELGRAYLAQEDYAAARTQFQPGAAQGYPPALNALGVMYSRGFGVDKDPAEADKLTRDAAEHGFLMAQYNLGTMALGRAAEGEDSQADLAWELKAAEQGMEAAQETLALAYASGKGLPQDDSRAYYWFSHAAAQGAANASFRLGEILEHGRGTARDLSAARLAYRQAANHGLDKARLRLLALGADEALFVDLPDHATWIKQIASASCQYLTERELDACYVSFLRRYLGQAKELANEDKRDAAVLCGRVRGLTKSDGAFCHDFRNLEPALFEQTRRDAAAAAARDQQRQAAESKGELKLAQATARGTATIPGAILCPQVGSVPNMEVGIAAGTISAEGEETIEEFMERAMRDYQEGLPFSETSVMGLRSFGCTLVPSGTSMMIGLGGTAPVATATLPDGTVTVGYTDWPMIREPDPHR